MKLRKFEAVALINQLQTDINRAGPIFHTVSNEVLTSGKLPENQANRIFRNSKLSNASFPIEITIAPIFLKNRPHRFIPPYRCAFEISGLLHRDLSITCVEPFITSPDTAHQWLLERLFEKIESRPSFPHDATLPEIGKFINQALLARGQPTAWGANKQKADSEKVLLTFHPQKQIKSDLLIRILGCSKDEVSEHFSGKQTLPEPNLVDADTAGLGTYCASFDGSTGLDLEQKRAALNIALANPATTMIVEGRVGTGKSSLVPHALATRLTNFPSPDLTRTIILTGNEHTARQQSSSLNETASADGVLRRWLPGISGGTLPFSAWLGESKVFSTINDDYFLRAYLHWCDSFEKKFDLVLNNIWAMRDYLTSVLVETQVSIANYVLNSDAVRHRIQLNTKSDLAQQLLEQKNELSRLREDRYSMVDSHEPGQAIRTPSGARLLSLKASIDVLSYKLRLISHIENLGDLFNYDADAKQVSVSNSVKLSALFRQSLDLAVAIYDAEILIEFHSMGTVDGRRLFPFIFGTPAQAASFLADATSDSTPLRPGLLIVDDSHLLPASIIAPLAAISSTVVSLGHGTGSARLFPDVNFFEFAKSKNIAFSRSAGTGQPVSLFKNYTKHPTLVDAIRRLTGKGEAKKTVSKNALFRPLTYVLAPGKTENDERSRMKDLFAWLRIAERTITSTYNKPLKEIMTIWVPPELTIIARQEASHFFDEAPVVESFSSVLQGAEYPLSLVYGDNRLAHDTTAMTNILSATQDSAMIFSQERIEGLDEVGFDLSQNDILCDMFSYLSSSPDDRYLSVKDGKHHDAFLRFFLRSAKRKILISSLHYEPQPKGRDNIESWLIEAAQRGVEVTLLIGAKASFKLNTRVSLEQVQRFGVSACVVDDFHSKAILVDDVIKSNGSRNWLFAHGGEDAYHEDTSILYGPSLREDIQEDWHHYRKFIERHK